VPKGKGKRTREDDIPPALTPATEKANACLEKLKQRLFCHSHTVPGKKAYCTISKSGEKGRGGHDPVSHQDMTLWAKQMVSSEIE
jgi:hypothetical protein